MDSLRRAKPLARFVLLWFVLSLGAAIASPWIKPQPLQIVCSVAGVAKLVAASDDGAPSPLAHTLDCPLCATSVAPPPLAQAVAAPLHEAPALAQPYASSHEPRNSAAPLPARGPPVSA